jgi:hypothetical protein
MKTETIVMCIVALILGMLMANMLKDVCGCKNLVEGQSTGRTERAMKAADSLGIPVGEYIQREGRRRAAAHGS